VSGQSSVNKAIKLGRMPDLWILGVVALGSRGRRILVMAGPGWWRILIGVVVV
jgi:hypothetical protein